MKTNTLQLPIAATREIALAIVDQLPNDEYLKFVSDIQKRNRNRALSSLRRFSTTVRKSGLKQIDFTNALGEVRASKTAHSRH